MISNSKYFKRSATLPVDKFFEDVLYNKKYGYYCNEIPFGRNGDYITSPEISFLFSEMVAIWIISTWEVLGKPKNFNLVELGPGNGKLINYLTNIFKNFPQFNKSTSVFLYEKSNLLKKKQKKILKTKKIKWVTNFSKINKGPVIFIGNEFFDAIPIKQFIKKKNIYFEKNYFLNKSKFIKELLKKIPKKKTIQIKKYRTLKNLDFIEYPYMGFKELEKIIKKIKKNSGGILLIDYGYVQSKNENTLQSVKNHKRNDLLSNLGKADITSLVNFKLLDEFFSTKNLKVKNIVSQSVFLKKLGIVERANNISKKMQFTQKADLYLRMKRLLDPQTMGNLFKVIFAYKAKKNNFVGFD